LEFIHNETLALLRGAILAGYSCQWTEFDKFLELCHRISGVVADKTAAAPPKTQEYGAEIDFQGIPGLEFAAGSSWVAMSGEEWQKTYKDNVADTNYLRGLYTNAMAPNVFGWDDFGAGASEIQSEETKVLDYTVYPTH
jgi:hypothetical protein